MTDCRPTDNCKFFGAPKAVFNIIISHEPLGTYRAFILSDTDRRRDVLLSSDSLDTTLQTLEHLLVKSADAVQIHISTYGLTTISVVGKDDEDDEDAAVHSVLSYADDLDDDKDQLADSRLSLESEAESAYESESASEDDRDGDGVDECDTTSYLRARNTRARSYDNTRTRRAPSLSRSRAHLANDTSGFHGRARQRHAAHNVPVAHRRRSSPPRSAPAPPAPPANGYVLSPSAGARFPPLPGPTQVPIGHTPPPPQRGPSGMWPMTSGPASGSGPHTSPTLKQQQQQQHFFQGPPAPMFPLRAEPSQYCPPQGGYTSTPHWTRVAQPPMQQQPPQQKTPMSMKSMYQLGTNFEMPRGMQMLHMPQMHPVLPPGRNHNQPPVPSSQGSSSASSTPTLTVSPNAPPEYSKPHGAAAPCLSSGTPFHFPEQADNKVDYRLLIKTETAADTLVEHRILMRTAPTRTNMQHAAVRHVLANPPLFSREGLRPSQVRAVVTRAVFTAAGTGREESYDLAAYGEEDFSKLCKSMAGGQSGKDEGGDGAAGGWPLFEVVVTAAAGGFNVIS